MADVMPNYHVEQKKLEFQIKNLEANLLRFELEILEIIDRKKKAIENIEATNRAVAEHTARLQSLEKEHGAPPSLKDMING